MTWEEGGAARLRPVKASFGVKVTPQGNIDGIPPEVAETSESAGTPIYALLGAIWLEECWGLVVVTDVNVVGEIPERVFRMTAWDVVKPGEGMDRAASGICSARRLLRRAMEVSELFFSESGELAKPIMGRNAGEKAISPLEGVASEFVWNSRLAFWLLEQVPDAEQAITPVIMGHIMAEDVALENSQKAQVVLIARRSNQRVGTRGKSRGVNEAGAVSNFAEVELRIALPSGISIRHVQLRGSVPLKWSGGGKLSKSDSSRALATHIGSLLETYGKIDCLDLLRKRGLEGRLSAAFRSAIESHELYGRDVSYLEYDLNGRHMPFCTTMMESALSEMIRDYVREQGAYIKQSDHRTLRVQDGVFRVNCKDCIDRTTMAQASISFCAVEESLRYLYGQGDECNYQSLRRLLSVLRPMWGDLGNVLARQYARTNALRTWAFKRVLPPCGLLSDATISTMRRLRAKSEADVDESLRFVVGD